MLQGEPGELATRSEKVNRTCPGFHPGNSLLLPPPPSLPALSIVHGAEPFLCEVLGAQPPPPCGHWGKKSLPMSTCVSQLIPRGMARSLEKIWPWRWWVSWQAGSQASYGDCRRLCCPAQPCPPGTARLHWLCRNLAGRNTTEFRISGGINSVLL